MPSAERSVTINRPAADVFAFVADGANAPQWRSGVVDIKLESGEGAGAVYRQRVRGPLRRKVAADYEITTYQPNKKLEFQAIAGPVRPRGGYRFNESDGKTKVTFWLDAELGRVKRLLMGRSVQKSMDAEMKALDRLKEVLEARPATKSAAAAATTSAAKPKTAASKSAPARSATPRTARRRSKAS